MAGKVEQIITDRILAQLRNGVIPWRRPWWTAGAPRNYDTNRNYSGINFFLLSMLGHADPRFITGRAAAKKHGWAPIKGKSIPIVFYKKLESKTKVDRNGNPATYMMLRYYNVWNIADVDDSNSDTKIEPMADAPNCEFTEIERCEQVLSSMPNCPPINHDGSRACYSPSSDIVTMPPRNRFEEPSEYYSTLFHELGHSTGHKSRCNRNMDCKQLGNYAREELIAEMIACFVCGHCGIESKTIGNTSAYIATWLECLGNDPKLVLTAGSKAQKGANYILDVADPYVKTKTQTQTETDKVLTPA